MNRRDRVFGGEILFSRTFKLAALGAAIVMMPVTGSGSVMAQTYPAQPIKVVIGFGPGSAADILARLVGKRMEASLGQPIVVENRPGNSSMIAAESVARAPADGYTLFMATIANTLNPAETKSGFDLGKDMAPITLLGIVPNVLVAHPSVAANNLRELIALAKSKPEGLTFGSSGYATASYMAAELFNAKAGTRIPVVPYQGGSNQAVSDLLAGRITLMFNVAATLAPHVEAGKLRALAVAQPNRASIMPDVPHPRGGWNDRLRRRNLDRTARTEGNATRDRRETVGGCQRCVEHRGGSHRVEGAGHRSRRRHARAICRLHPRRHRKVDRDAGLVQSREMIARQGPRRARS
jgi:tripartite-type tricarboxylate transporter receptor subunit TctC